jgi:hypothetical protein
VLIRKTILVFVSFFQFALHAQHYYPRQKGTWNFGTNFGVGSYHRWQEKSGIYDRPEPLQLGLSLGYLHSSKSPVLELSLLQNRFSGYTGNTPPAYTYGDIKTRSFSLSVGYDLLRKNEIWSITPFVGLAFISVYSEKRYPKSAGSLTYILETYAGRHVSIPVTLAIERNIIADLHAGIFAKTQWIHANVWMQKNNSNWDRFTSGGMSLRWEFNQKKTP